MRPDLTTLWQMIEARGRADFIVAPRKRFSYRALAKQIEHVCGAFDKAGLRAGDRVTIALEDESLASASFLAAMLDGLVPVMLSPDAAAERCAAIAERLEARLVLDDANPPPVPGGFLKRSRSASTVARRPKLPNLDDDALAYVLFTSGTTAEPRGVQVTHKNLFSQLQTLIRLFDYKPGARIFNATPLAHTDGLVQGPLLAAVSGATLVRPGLFEVSDLESWLDFLRSETATHMITNPTLLTILLRMAQEDDYFDPAQFQGIVSTGGILTQEICDGVESRFGVRVWNVYGMTETVSDALYAGDHPEMGARGTIGRPIDCTARIAGGLSEGELELFGDNIVPGYWRDANQTASSRTSDGWFRTGDIVRARPDGSFDFLGRTKTTINQGAVTIHPEEINEALMSHSQVLEVVTVGLPDAEFEEIAISGLVLAQPVDEAELFTHCASRLEPLKRPKRIVALESIPKMPSGKVDVARLKQIVQGAAVATATGKTGHDDTSLGARVLSIAASVFGAAIDDLDLNSSTDTVPGWDSFNHLKLMLEVEEQMGVSLSTKDIISIRTLSDLLEKLDDAKA